MNTQENGIIEKSRNSNNTGTLKAMADQSNRIAITLSPYETKMLKLWAAIHGRPPSTYAAQIIGARIESNAELIRREIGEMARMEGVSVEEIEVKILGESD
jgi:hypothetical protein